ncbi:unnamed protein product, partial [Timema podura]|nr:unnamed protein product [Timema podura]
MVEDVTQLTWEDLEDIGIVKLGHQKKIMLAIKRVKDVRAGKRFPINIQHADVIVSQRSFASDCVGQVKKFNQQPRFIHNLELRDVVTNVAVPKLFIYGVWGRGGMQTKLEQTHACSRLSSIIIMVQK